MKKLSKFLLALLLLFSFSLAPSPNEAQAATYNYCSDPGRGVHSATNTWVEYGDKKYGACHIAYYHMFAVGTLSGRGTKSILISGQRKSQFSKQLTAVGMANVAGGIISQGNVTPTPNGNYRAEGFDISLNQYVRVIFYYKKFNNTTTKRVVTMYPYK